LKKSRFLLGRLRGMCGWAVNPSIPTISADLHSSSGYIWIGGAYLLANAAAGPIWAKCSDIWGRK
jgi:MFS family permease